MDGMSHPVPLIVEFREYTETLIGQSVSKVIAKLVVSSEQRRGKSCSSESKAKQVATDVKFGSFGENLADGGRA